MAEKFRVENSMKLLACRRGWSPTGGAERFCSVSQKAWADRDRRLWRYAELWAKQEAAKGRRYGNLEGKLRAAWRFNRGYVLKKGFDGGWLGLRIAMSCAREVFEKYRALRS